MQLKVCAERSLFLYNMEIVDAQCDYMQTVQKASLQLMLIFIILSWKKYLKTNPNGSTQRFNPDAFDIQYLSKKRRLNISDILNIFLSRQGRSLDRQITTQDIDCLRVRTDQISNIILYCSLYIRHAYNCYIASLVIITMSMTMVSRDGNRCEESKEMKMRILKIH